MFNWLRELFDILEERRERKKVCTHCEFLQLQLEKSNQERQRLQDKLLKDPEPIRVEGASAPIQIPRKNIPWPVKQQMLERKDAKEAAQLAEDREKQKLEAEFKKRVEAAKVEVNTDSQVDELEKKLGIIDENDQPVPLVNSN